MKKYFLTLALAIITLHPAAYAKRQKAKGAFVVTSDKLPLASQRSGDAIFLHTSDCDTTYLYLEQDNGKRLVILQVDEPARIKLKAVIDINAPSVFDFKQRLGEHTVLIQYRNGSGYKFLDLSNPKKPVLKSTNAPASETFIEPVGIMDGGHSVRSVTGEIRDYNIIDKKHNRVLTTVKQVQQVTVDSATGATYLLGENGLTVVRDPQIESSILPCHFYDNVQ